mmetsp:Transcript_5532/g.13475  ORF Transcript_5532/g.13475 Transcript_5532/m.13475 type:complete len:124 (-) Transcript_5532:173-544(-)
MLGNFKATPSMFNMVVIIFTTVVALVTVYELSYSNRVAQILKGVSTTSHRTALFNTECIDPTKDVEFKMFSFHGRDKKVGSGHTYFLYCKENFKPKGDFRRGEIACWSGEWIWLTSVLECTDK